MTQPAKEFRLGWLGLGRMGSVLAGRLLAAGCDVAVYNRSAAKAEPLAAAGAKVAGSAADLATRDIVFVTVGTPQDLMDAVLGPGGLMSSGAAPSILVDCSTISAEASQHVREQLGQRGTTLLAAPVMGNPKVASAGRLTLAVSGPRDTFERARPYLDLLGAGSGARAATPASTRDSLSPSGSGWAATRALAIAPVARAGGARGSASRTRAALKESRNISICWKRAPFSRTMSTGIHNGASPANTKSSNRMRR